MKNSKHHQRNQNKFFFHSNSTTTMQPSSATSTTPKTIVDVLVLCGLPGSGKSRLAQACVEWAAARTTAATATTDQRVLKVHHVEYDQLQDSIAIVQQQQQRRNFTEECPSVCDGKSDQPTFVYKQETPLEPSTTATTTDDNNSDSAFLTSWRQSRKAALHLLRQLIQQQQYQCQWYNSKQEPTEESSSSLAEMKRPTTRHVVILMDDNFYWRSMRKQVYQTCQECLGVATPPSTATTPSTILLLFGTVWMDTPVEICCQRNRQRLVADRIVSKDVILRMRQNLEVPPTNSVAAAAFASSSSLLHGWEKSSCTLHVDGTANSTGEHHLLQLVDFIQRRAASPECYQIARSEDPAMQVERVRKARQETSQSVGHAADQFWRQCVAITVRLCPYISGQNVNRVRQQCITEFAREHDTVASDDAKRQWMEAFLHGLSAIEAQTDMVDGDVRISEADKVTLRRKLSEITF